MPATAPSRPEATASEHVEVALDQERRAGLANRLLGHVETVEERALVEVVGLGGVDVLRLVVAQRAAAEADDAAGGVLDREDQPVAEAVVVTATLGRAADQAGRLEPLGAEVDAQGVGQGLPAFGGVAEAEALDQLGRDLALGEVAARCLGAPELLGEEAGGGFEGRGELEGLAPTVPARRTRRQRHPVAPGERLDGGGEVVARELHVEPDRVAAAAAAEAVVEALGGVDAEGGGLLLVQRAEPAVAVTRLLEPRVVARHVDDVDRVPDGLHELWGEVDVAQSHGVLDVE